MYDYYEPEDQPTDELIYGRCRMCYQIEELGPDNLCLVCEGHENERKHPKAMKR